MTNRETNEAIMACIVGRKLVAYEIDYDEGILYLEFDSGVIFSMFPHDEQFHLCIDVERTARS